MAYALPTDIEADFKDITFGADDNVTGDDVTQFIVEADALINSYIGTVYTVPVTTGDGLNVLKLLSRSLVSNRIKKILEVQQVASKGANQNIQSTYLSVTQVMAVLTSLQAKKVALAGASPLVSAGGFYSNNSSNDVAPTITKDTRQW